MTVASTENREVYNGNGVTVAFAFAHKFFVNADLKVYVDGVLLALTTDYTVSGAGDEAGGTVTFLVAPPIGTGNVVILRDPAATQERDFVENDPLPAEEVENALDLLTMLIQRLKELQGRSLTLSDVDTTSASTTLPTPTSGNLIGWAGDGTSLENYDPASLLTVAGSSGSSDQKFSGTGAQTVFTLSDVPGSLANVEVFISGVRQYPTADYTITSSTLTFVVAPPVGTDNVYVRWGTTLGIGVPSDESVTTVKLADGSVTSEKIVDLSVITSKIDALAVTTEKLDDQSVTSAKLDDALISGINDFRLTLTTGVPVTTSNVTSATTIYCCPKVGNRIALYDGTRWNVRTSAEFSLALGTLTSGLPYDVFCYDNASTPTLEFAAWTNGTTRATALAYRDGVLVKSGAITRRYLGTFYTTATTTTEDSATKRYLWNYYHRACRHVERYDSTTSWTYTSVAWRQANNSTNNQIEYVCGLAENEVNVFIQGTATNSVASTYIQVGAGVDSTSTASGLTGRQGQPANSVEATATAKYCGVPGVGRHYIAWLESSEATGTQTWVGTNDPIRSGIVGTVFS